MLEYLVSTFLVGAPLNRHLDRPITSTNVSLLTSKISCISAKYSDCINLYTCNCQVWVLSSRLRNSDKNLESFCHYLSKCIAVGRWVSGRHGNVHYRNNETITSMYFCNQTLKPFGQLESGRQGNVP